MNITDKDNEKESINEHRNNDLSSIDLIYDQAVIQYNLAIKSVENLDTKSIGIITLDAAILSIGSIFISNLIGKLSWNSALFVLLFQSYLLILIAMVLSGYAFKVKYYPTIGISKLHEKYYDNAYIEIKDQLSSNLGEQIKKILASTKKMKKLINFSIILTMVGVTLLAISNLLSLLI